MIRGMSERRSAPAARALMALAALGIALTAFLAGMLMERLLYDSRRGQVLQRYDQVLEQHQKQIMDAEKTSSR